MTEKTKRDWVTLAATVVIAAVIYWLIKKRQAQNNANPETYGENLPGGFPAQAFWGPSGQPFAQGNQGLNNIFTNNIQVPIPNYGYGGNSSVYMPMFGFVGYSDVGTYG